MFVKTIFCAGLWISHPGRGTILAKRDSPKQLDHADGPREAVLTEAANPNHRRLSAVASNLAGGNFLLI